jgi:hypothetical protein
MVASSINRVVSLERLFGAAPTSSRCTITYMNLLSFLSICLPSLSSQMSDSGGSPSASQPILACSSTRASTSLYLALIRAGSGWPRFRQVCARARDTEGGSGVQG